MGLTPKATPTTQWFFAKQTTAQQKPEPCSKSMPRGTHEPNLILPAGKHEDGVVKPDSNKKRQRRLWMSDLGDATQRGVYRCSNHRHHPMFRISSRPVLDYDTPMKPHEVSLRGFPLQQPVAPSHCPRAVLKKAWPSPGICATSNPMERVETGQHLEMLRASPSIAMELQKYYELYQPTGPLHPSCIQSFSPTNLMQPS